ncbi:hypothetical protein DACRYDRAFT_22831 [Dacryopinax primogenitus]|uniref:Protein YAE1 n=1 Tax=Dacryopinax primogenitus (strain DJM 731) TaxID=1858805 RepID=M5FTM7_DACPD|nr:uncharacterized protein DACRYDRAFT_22831 [Dacryopinax primogenitus]EJU01006.1 hypothetical protein DACRYDRAFT_22831 [Dacryopinax primogenitus]
MDDAWMDEGEMDERSTADREWNSLADKYTNDGYREGISAGKEEHLQEGFDQGFAKIGVPVGRNLGNLRGTAAALLQYLTQLQPQARHNSEEVNSIAKGLSELQLQDVAPRDAEAIAHAREHGIEDEEVDPAQQMAKALEGMKTADGQLKLQELTARLQALLSKTGLQ